MSFTACSLLEHSTQSAFWFKLNGVEPLSQDAPSISSPREAAPSCSEAAPSPAESGSGAPRRRKPTCRSRILLRTRRRKLSPSEHFVQQSRGHEALMLSAQTVRTALIQIRQTIRKADRDPSSAPQDLMELYRMESDLRRELVKIAKVYLSIPLPPLG